MLSSHLLHTAVPVQQHVAEEAELCRGEAHPEIWVVQEKQKDRLSAEWGCSRVGRAPPAPLQHMCECLGLEGQEQQHTSHPAATDEDAVS